MTGTSAADIDEILHAPAALALHQRPGVPRNTEYIWNKHGIIKQPAVDVFQACQHCCPNGHFFSPFPLRRGWKRAYMPYMQRSFLCPIC